MGQELGRRKAVHEILVDIELQIGDPLPNPVYFFQATIRAQQHGGAAEGTISQRFESLQWQVRQHAIDDDDGVIDEHAERDDQRGERHLVEADPEPGHHQQRHHHGHRNQTRHHQAGSDAEAEQHHDDDDRDRLHQVADELVDLAVDGVGLELQVDIETGWKTVPKIYPYAGFEYHWAMYYAQADWNLRQDFDHVKSFEHEAQGSGIRLTAGIGTHFTAKWSLDVGYTQQQWSTEDGVDNVYLSDGSQLETQLNEVNWESRAIGIALRYHF